MIGRSCRFSGRSMGLMLMRKAIRANRMSQNPVRLAKALRDYGTGNMPNLWPQISSIAVRTFILTGEKDEKFVRIGQN